MDRARLVFQNVAENYFYVPRLDTVIVVSYIDWIFNFILVVLFSVGLSSPPAPDDVWNEEWYHEEVRNMSILLGLHIIELLSVTVLVFSLHTKNWRLMRIFIYCGSVAAPLATLFICYDYFTAALYHFSDPIDALLNVSKIALQLYLLILMENSYRSSKLKDLRNSKDIEGKLCLT